MRNNIELDEDLICREYIEGRDGIETLSKKYHVGKLRIKEILIKNNIDIKKRGNQTLGIKYVVNNWRIPKYIEKEGGFYIAVDRNNGYSTKDYMNNGGFLTTHINKVYDIEIPTLYERRQYYMKTGNYWWEQWFDIKFETNKPTKKCPYCDWETIDIDNVSGWFEQHLLKEHGISAEEHLKNYPEDIDFFKTYKKQKKRETRLLKNGEYVICPLCEKRFNKLTEAHMVKIHGMTLHDFKEKYPGIEIMSRSALKQTLQANSLGNLTVSKSRFVSVYERELQDFLTKNGIEFAPNRQLLIGKEIDILCEKYKIGIEFDGLKFHTEKFGKKDHNYHLNKTLKCNEKGYSLIHIFEDEYVNHKDLVYEKLKHFFHILEDKEKIYGRKCTIKEIYKYQAEEFLNKYHIQGFVSSSVYIGAFYNEKLIAVMSFKNGNIKNQGWELTRFASDYHYIMCGVGGKLLNYFLKKYKPLTISSFADRRWTLDINNNIYTKLGFNIEKINRPDYRYYNEKVSRYERIHKLRLNKQTLSKKYGFPMSMTESEMAKELGYDRIWDCGLVKYVYVNNCFVDKQQI